jgi:exopolysaccharide biosynthesis polyprenyl glycosylphosphotransferase
LLLASLPVLGAVGLRTATSPDVVAAVIAVTVLGMLTRVAGNGYLGRLVDEGALGDRVVAVGDPDVLEPLLRQLHKRSSGLDVVGAALPAGASLAGVAAVPLLGDPAEHDALVHRIVESGATAVLLAAGGNMHAATLRRIARAAEWAGLEIFFAPSAVDVTSSAPVVPVSGAPVLRVPRPGPSGAARFVKNVMDRVGAGLGLIVLFPVLVAITVLIRLDSKGPALFRQERVGAHGRTFTMVKFRTMHSDAERLIDDLAAVNEGAGPLFKIRNDPRVTRVGRVLRRTSLDELPQLVNVLRGQMSLVGPRPPLPREVATYTPAERRRLLVKPGLTGPWQVSGRSNLEWVDAVRLDLNYVTNWSMSMDLRLIARTFAAVARRDGAF